MTRKKHKKVLKEDSDNYDYLIIDPESYDDLASLATAKDLVIKFSKILEPLYSSTFDSDNKPVKSFTKPVSFVYLQIAIIGAFLVINSYFYVAISEMFGVTYFTTSVKKVVREAAVKVAETNNILDPEHDSTVGNIPFTMAKTFFDELNKILAVPIYDIVYNKEKLFNKMQKVQIIDF